MRKKIIQILWGVFLFAFPFSLRFIFYDRGSYHSGNFSPWATGFFYLPELLLGILTILWIIDEWRSAHFEWKMESKWMGLILSVFALNAFAVTFFRGNAWMGAQFILRLFEAFLVCLFISKSIIQPRQVVTILLFGALFQILLGYFQWRLNGSLGIAFLGEPKIGPDVLNAAKIDLAGGMKQVRAYGTFLHPNILAGYLLTVFFLSLSYLKKQSWPIWFALFTWGIYLTHSRAGFIVFFFGLAVTILFLFMRSSTSRRGAVFFFLLALAIMNLWFFKNSHAVHFDDPAIEARLTQNTISRKMWEIHPFGVGVSNFTLEMNKFSDKKLLPWDFQPVHNGYFLVLNETGGQGLLLLLVFLALFFARYWKHASPIPILMLLYLVFFDHYLWDSFTGMILIGIAGGMFVIENKGHIS